MTRAATARLSEPSRPPSDSHSRSAVLLAEVAVVLMALIWGINFSVIKFGTTALPPLAYNGLRVPIAAVCLVIIAWIWGGAPPSRRDAFALLALGMLGNGLYQIFFAEGIARTRAGEAALVVGASPALIALIGRLRGVEFVSARGVFGIALSIFGVGLVVLGRAATGVGPQGGSLFGDLLVLCGSLCWALYTVLLIPYTRRVNGFWVLALSLVGGSIVLVGAGARQMLGVDWLALSAPVWAAVLYAGFGGLVVAYIFWYRGVQVLGPTRTHLYANLQPAIALVVAWITLGETPTAWQLVGAATIITGVLLTRVQAPTEA